MIRFAGFFGPVLLLAACEGREIVSICASVGDPQVDVAAARFDADGARTALAFDAADRTVAILRDSQDTPALPRLWRVAENTMRIAPEVEWTPCGLPTQTVVRVTFDDGSVLERETSCIGNALSRVATEVLEAAEMNRLHDGAAAGQPDVPLATASEACDRLP